METAISTKDVCKKYGKNLVLDNININIAKGEFVCLLGPSGCGKSTLLRVIAGLDRPCSGDVFLNGSKATHTKPAKRNFGIMFQSYALFPNLTASENVAYGLKCRKIKTAEIQKIVSRYLEMVGLEEAKSRFPAQLSGGEQQRIALARALAISPNFLLLDEPLSALDAKVRQKLRLEICKIQKELMLTTIMVTHDQEEALTMADKIIVINNGRVVQEGTPLEIYEQPTNRFVADFIGSINFFPASDKQGILAVRPENINISRQNALSPSSQAAYVQGIEFRGNFSRVTAVAKAFEGSESFEFIVDLPIKTLKELDLKINDSVFLNFPKQDEIIQLSS